MVVQIEVGYVGPHLVNEATIRTNIHIKVGDVLHPATIDDDVRKLYATGLFYNIRVANQPEPEGVSLIYIVQCNLRLVSIHFNGNSKFNATTLRKGIASKVGGLLNERTLFQDCQTIQEMYEKAGYKGIAVKYVYQTDTQAGQAKVTFEITEGR